METLLLEKVVAGSPGWALQGPPPQEPRALRTQLRGETRGPLALLLLEPKSFLQQPCCLQTYSFVNAQLIPKRSAQTLKTPHPSFPEAATRQGRLWSAEARAGRRAHPARRPPARTATTRLAASRQRCQVRGSDTPSCRCGSISQVPRPKGSRRDCGEWAEMSQFPEPPLQKGFRECGDSGSLTLSKGVSALGFSG